MHATHKPSEILMVMETQTLEYKQTWRDPHNPDIAATFFRAGEVEAWGQGMERIQTYCTDYGCPAPEWRFDGAGIWTIFYNKTNPNTEGKSSQKSSQKILELIAANTRISTQEMADSIGVSRRAIAKTIAKLQMAFG